MLSILDFAIPIWNLFGWQCFLAADADLKVEGDFCTGFRERMATGKTEPCDALRGALSVYEDGITVQLDNEMACVRKSHIIDSSQERHLGKAQSCSLLNRRGGDSGQRTQS